MRETKAKRLRRETGFEPNADASYNTDPRTGVRKRVDKKRQYQQAKRKTG